MTTLAGSRYILVFIEDFSIKSWIYFLQYKAQTFEYFFIFKAKIELKTRKRIAIMRNGQRRWIPIKQTPDLLPHLQDSSRVDSSIHSSTKRSGKSQKPHHYGKSEKFSSWKQDTTVTLEWSNTNNKLPCQPKSHTHKSNNHAWAKIHK